MVAGCVTVLVLEVLGDRCNVCCCNEKSFIFYHGHLCGCPLM